MCTSQSLFSLAAAIQCTSRELVDPSDLSCLLKEPVCRKEDRLLIDIGTVYRVIPRLPMQKRFGLLKASGSQIYCSSSLCRKKPLESSENFDRTIAEVKQTTMFSDMADEAATFLTEENLLLSSAMSTLQRIFERRFLVSAIIVEKKQPVTQSRSFNT